MTDDIRTGSVGGETEPTPTPAPTPAPASPAGGASSGYTAAPRPPYYGYGYPPAPPKPTRRYTEKEGLFAYLSLPVAFLVCRAFPFSSYPLGSTLCAALLFALFLSFPQKKQPVNAVGYLFLALAGLSSLAPLFTSNQLLIALDLLFGFACLLLFLLYRSGSATDGVNAAYFPTDVCRSVFSLPFSHLGAIYPAFPVGFPKGGRGKRVGSALLYILFGLLLTLIPSVIVVQNLSYDSAFSGILKQMFRFDWGRIGSYIVSLIFTLPVAMLLYGILAGNSEPTTEEKREQRRTKAQARSAACRKLPVLTSVTAAVPLVFFYLIFFFSQKENYLSAFTGVLPDGFIYSTYAREGFFELCRVAALNAVVILLCSVFSRRAKSGGLSVAVRVVSAVLSVCSLILIATALAKMAMYIAAYGLTRLRVYVTLFMLLLAVAFLFVLIKQFAPSLKMTWVCVVLAAIMLLLPSFGDMDARIAEYNVDRYLDGTLSDVDFNLLRDIPEASLPALVRLYESDTATEKVKAPVFSVVFEFRQVRGEAEDESIFSFSLPRLNAKAAENELYRLRELEKADNS